MKQIIAGLTAIILLLCSATYAENTLPIIDEAILHLNKPYVYSAIGPSAFDCSGFTYYLFKKVYGVELKRSAYDQGYDKDYKKIENIKDLMPGDIICFNTNRKDKDLSDHVGLYLGHGEFIHASSGSKKVIISSLKEGYYNQRFSWGLIIIQQVRPKKLKSYYTIDKKFIK